MTQTISNAPASRFFSRPSNYLLKNRYVGLRKRLVREMLPGPSAKRIVDIGCGDGAISLQFADEASEIALVDSSQPMLEMAMRNVAPTLRDRVVPIHGDVRTFAANRPYDFVLCIGVLAHVPNWPEAIASVSRAVVDGGYCLIQFTDFDSWAGKAHVSIGYLRKLLHLGPIALGKEMGYREVMEVARRNRLRLVDARRYLFIPATRLLPEPLASVFLDLLGHGMIADRGGEVLALLRKE